MAASDFLYPLGPITEAERNRRDDEDFDATMLSLARAGVQPERIAAMKATRYGTGAA